MFTLFAMATAALAFLHEHGQFKLSSLTVSFCSMDPSRTRQDLDRSSQESMGPCTLLVKRIASDIYASEETAMAFFRQFHATGVRCMQSRSMRNRAFVDFPHRIAAEQALQQLNQRGMQAEWAFTQGQSSRFTTEPTPIAPELGVHYPANPHLRYRYPDPTPEILSNITHAIATVPRLYVQVLHLMNKLNLRPPFQARDAVLSLNKRSYDDFLASDESDTEVQDPSRARHDNDKTTPTATAIPVTSSAPVLLASQASSMAENTPTVQAASSTQDIMTKSQIRAGCMDPATLMALPVTKNYTRGEPSKRLYVKNITKQAEEHDLEQLFSSFHPTSIDLKKTGRLRGQAFITFDDTSNATAALETIHGFVLHDKPLIIQFSRSGD